MFYKFIIRIVIHIIENTSYLVRMWKYAIQKILIQASYMSKCSQFPRTRLSRQPIKSHQIFL